MSSISSSSISMDTADYDDDYSDDLSESEEIVPTTTTASRGRGRGRGRGGRTIAQTSRNTAPSYAAEEEEIVVIDAEAESRRLVRHRGETDDVFQYRQEIYRRIRSQTLHKPNDCTMYAMMIVNYAMKACLPTDSDLKLIREIALECGIEI